MTNNQVIPAYPLSWPAGWKRTASYARQRGRFASGTGYSATLTIGQAVERVRDALRKMRVHNDDIVISTNLELRLDGFPRSGQAQPNDPGASVYWKAGKETRCMAIDAYSKVEQNIAAIAATLDAMRAIERHGGATILDRAFSGFKALPQTGDTSIPNWRDVLELKGNVSIEDVKIQYRAKAKIHHPDVGGDPGAFATLTRAYEMALQELGG